MGDTETKYLYGSTLLEIGRIIADLAGRDAIFTHWCRIVLEDPLSDDTTGYTFYTGDENNMPPDRKLPIPGNVELVSNWFFNCRSRMKTGLPKDVTITDGAEAGWRFYATEGEGVTVVRGEATYFVRLPESSKLN